MKQIYKTIFREFRFEKKRTFLLFLVFFVIIAFPLAMFSIEPSISSSVIESNSTYQLSYLDMGFQGDANEISESINYLKSTHTNYSNLVFEIRPSCSFQLYHSKKWYYTNIIGINTSAPPKVNQISTKTDFTELRNETAFILESFARELKVKIGDSITLYTLAGVKEVTITGLVKSIEFLSYDLSLEGAIYLNYETFQDYNSWTELQFNSIAFYFPNEPPIDTIKQFAKDLKEEVDPFKAQILYERYFINKLNKAGRPKLIIFTGLFVNSPEAPVDLLLVGRFNKRKLVRLVKELESELSKEINYTIMGTHEFKYRRDITDVFLYDILGGKKIVIVDELGIC